MPGKLTKAPNYFEALMAEGVRAQAAGDHEEALGHRQAAFDQATTATGQARALRDGAASHAKLGQLDEALQAALASRQLLAGEARHSREYYVSQAQVGRLAVLYGVASELDDYQVTSAPRNVIPWQELQAAHDGLARAEYTPYPDQYRINLAARLSAAYSFDGRRRQALRTGISATGLAIYSESPVTEGSNPRLSHRERFKSKAKHLLAGGTAVMAAVVPSRTVTLRLAERICR